MASPRARRWSTEGLDGEPPAFDLALRAGGLVAGPAVSGIGPGNRLGSSATCLWRLECPGGVAEFECGFQRADCAAGLAVGPLVGADALGFQAWSGIAGADRVADTAAGH